MSVTTATLLFIIFVPPIALAIAVKWAIGHPRLNDEDER